MTTKFKEFEDVLYKQLLRDLTDDELNLMINQVKEGSFYIGSLNRISQAPNGFGVFRAKKETVFGVFNDGLDCKKGKISFFQRKVKVPRLKSDLTSNFSYQGEIVGAAPQNQGILCPYRKKKIFYEGESKDGEFHGQGKLTHQGVSYTGTFEKGVFIAGNIKLQNAKAKFDLVYDHGRQRGLVLYNDGSRYEGEVNNDKPQGSGSYQCSQYTYTGSYKNGLRHGPGAVSFSNGNTFEGNWEKDKMMKGRGILKKEGNLYNGQLFGENKEGYGMMVFASGDTYDGEWVNNQMQGSGTLRYKSGEAYMGDFIKNKRHGQGTLYNKEKQIVYEGSFENDQYHGDGVLYMSDSIYTGAFLNNQKNGRGTLELQNGDVYDGNWKGDFYQGNGALVTQQFKYVGSFKKGQFNGMGTLTFGNIVYRGDFKDGQKHGQGYETEGEGEISGEWVKGVRHGLFSQEVEIEGVVKCIETTYKNGKPVSKPRKS